MKSNQNKVITYVMVLAMFSILGIGFVMAGPTTKIPLIGDGDIPIYTQVDFEPLVFLNTFESGRVLYSNQYFNGNIGENGPLTERMNNYIFTGEQIQWKVLIWDKNGVPDKIKDVWAGWTTQTNGPLDPETQVNCQYIRAIPNSKLSTLGYPNVRRPGDQEPQINGNPATMGEYLCTLTIEPNCHGQKWIGVKVEDLDGNTGVMTESESWFCNPELDLTVSGSMDFGELGPGEQGHSTISVRNSAEDGSGVQVVLAISGKDFYDPSNSGAMCPTTNSLKLQGVEGATTPFKTGFWYRAVMGSNQTPYKRIPYGEVISKADPVFSTSNGINADWSSQLVPMSPGAEVTMTFYLGIPQPCNGQFTNGQIYLYSWAI